MDQVTFTKPKAVSVTVSRWNACITVLDADDIQHEYVISIDNGDGMYMDEDK